MIEKSQVLIYHILTVHTSFEVVHPGYLAGHHFLFVIYVQIRVIIFGISQNEYQIVRPERASHSYFTPYVPKEKLTKAKYVALNRKRHQLWEKS